MIGDAAQLAALALVIGGGFALIPQRRRWTGVAFLCFAAAFVLLWVAVAID